MPILPFPTEDESHTSISVSGFFWPMCPGCLLNELRGLNSTFEVEMTYVVTSSMFLHYDFTVQFKCFLHLGRLPWNIHVTLRRHEIWKYVVSFDIFVSFVIVSDNIFVSVTPVEQKQPQHNETITIKDSKVLQRHQQVVTRISWTELHLSEHRISGH